MQHRISHLLVVDDREKLLGIVSDRDLKESWASPATTLSIHELKYLLDRLTVGMIMAKTVISVSPDTTIERAARTMQEKVISSLPVVDDGKLVGILTRTDVMGVLLQAIGIDTDSMRLIVLVNDRIGVMAEVSSILKAAADQHPEHRQLAAARTSGGFSVGDARGGPRRAKGGNGA